MNARHWVFALISTVALGACAHPAEKKTVEIIQPYLAAGLARNDGFKPLYVLTTAFDIDGSAAFFNGLTPEPMDIEGVLPHAITGDAGAQASLFFRYYNGVDAITAAKFKVKPVEVDVCAAANWLHKSARQKFGTSLLWMAFIYERGDGVTRDPKEALRWYMAWLESWGLYFMGATPLYPERFDLTDNQFREIIQGFPEWRAKESERPLLDLPACPGIGPKIPKKS